MKVIRMKQFRYVLEIQSGYMASDNKYNPEPHYKPIEVKDISQEEYMALIATIPSDGGEFMFRGEPNIVKKKTTDLQVSSNDKVKKEMRLIVVIITKAMDIYYKNEAEVLNSKVENEVAERIKNCKCNVGYRLNDDGTLRCDCCGKIMEDEDE